MRGLFRDVTYTIVMLVVLCVVIASIIPMLPTMIGAPMAAWFNSINQGLMSWFASTQAQFAAFGAGIQKWFADSANWWQQQLAAIPQAAYNTLVKPAQDTLSAGWQWVQENIVEPAQNAPNWIAEQLEGFKQWTYDNIIAPAQGIWNDLLNAAESIKQWIEEHVVSPISDWAQQVMETYSQFTNPEQT